MGNGELKQRTRHVLEQLKDAELVRADLARSMIDPQEGAKEARQMFRHVVRRMRLALRVITPELVGSEPVVCDRLRVAIYATLTELANRGRRRLR